MLGTILTIIAVAIAVGFAKITYEDRKYAEIACAIFALSIAYLFFVWECPLGLAAFIMTIPFVPISGFLPFKEGCEYKKTLDRNREIRWASGTDKDLYFERKFNELKYK